MFSHTYGAVMVRCLHHFRPFLDLDMFCVLGGEETGRRGIFYCPRVETIYPAVEQKSDNVRFHVVD
jgi:hypothetical protein